MPLHGRRIARHTVLIVGEGKTEWAFLRHIRSLYIVRDCGVSAKIGNVRGGGPDLVVDYAIKQRKNAEYDRVAVLLDTDREMPAEAQECAESEEIQIIGSTPCIEGLLLKILDEPVPNTCRQCKARVRHFLQGQLTTPETYREKFPKDVLVYCPISNMYY